MSGIYDDGGWYGSGRSDFPSQATRDALDAAGTDTGGIYDDGATYGSGSDTEK